MYLQAKHLRARGVDVVLVTRPPTREGIAFPGTVVTVPYGSRRLGAHGRVLDRIVHYPAFSARVGDATAGLVRDGAVDIVDAQGLAALGYARLRAAEPALRAPLVMNPQGMEEHKAGGLKRLALTRLRALSQEAARLADRVVATDEATRDDVPRLLGVDPGKVVVLPNGVDPAEIAALTPADPARVVEEAVPGVARAEGQVKGALASAEDLAIAGYDELTAEEISGKLAGLSQIELAKVAAYERKHDDRSTVLTRISALQGDEPWPGYDELTVDEIRAAIGDDEDRASDVRRYERAHKNRAGVISAAERELASA